MTFEDAEDAVCRSAKVVLSDGRTGIASSPILTWMEINVRLDDGTREFVSTYDVRLYSGADV